MAQRLLRWLSTVPLTGSLSLVVTATGLLIGCLALGFSLAPGGLRLRWFSLVAFSAALYGFSNLLHELIGHSSLGRTSAAAVHLQAVAWSMYYCRQRRIALGPLDRAAIVAMLAIAGLTLVPNLLVADVPITRNVAWLGVSYADQPATTLGLLGYLLSLTMVVRVAIRFFRDWRAGIEGSLPQLVGLGILLAAAVNDLLATERLINTPYLIELAFLGVAIEVGLSLTLQFLSASKEQQRSAVELEKRVAERTEQLAHTRDALAQSEKLAAIGRLAAGVAHEINNPAAVVAANVEYLRSHFRTEKALPSDGGDALAECDASIRRIAAIVRELLDAGRIASTPGKPEPVNVLDVAEDASLTARKTLGAIDAGFELRIPAGIYALSGRHALVQSVSTLIINVVQAIGPSKGGRVVVAAEQLGDKVQLVVSDNGPGIPAAAQRKIFEPFFTTKGPGKGTGLGLSVSLGLMRALGGDLRLVSTSPAGTQMAIDLPVCPAPAAGAASEPAPSPPPRAGRRLLLIDDEPKLLAALSRSLGAHSVEGCSGVEAALKRVAAGPNDFDVIVCDVMMADGGGERLEQELRVNYPALADRMIFITGGATNDKHADFIRRMGARVLMKPFDTGALLKLANKI